MQLPDGTKFFISDGAPTPNFIEVKGLDDIDGNIGSKGELIKAGVLADTQEQYAASEFFDGGERNFKFRAEDSDPGQTELMTVCEAKGQRACQIRLPNGKQWDIEVQFAGWTYAPPTKKTPLQIEALGGVNVDSGFSTTV